MAERLPTGTVTFLFTDIEGSTRLLEQLGGGYESVLAEQRRLIREAVSAHDGVEVDTQGDAFLFAFSRASDAVQAATEAQGALAATPVRVRMGLHTGEPMRTEEGYVGVDLHRAARVMGAAHGGQVLVSQSTRDLVGDDVLVRDLGPHRLKDLGEPVRLFQLGGQEFPPLRSLNATNLPAQSNPLIGRERELREVTALLRDGARLVTLTGPGGTGKTRLALQAAAELADDYPDGVYWVPLAAIRESELVRPSVEQALDTTQPLERYLADRRTLLLLDNFEQIVEAAPVISSMLETARQLKVLVTSREPLNVSGEREYPVPSLTEEDAIVLFRERAEAVGQDVSSDAPVAEICRRLDHLPLAVELAAARIKALSAEQLRDRLERRLPLLTGGVRDAPERQRTLRATIEWSYDLLARDEQLLFARLAVFAGGFDLDAAEAVAHAELDTLQSLVDKNLIRRDGDRYSMLETIREFAVERLAAAGNDEELARRHRFYFARLAQASLESLRSRSAESASTTDARALWKTVERDLDNFRLALGSALDARAAEQALRLAFALGSFFWGFNPPEGLHWLRQALALPTGDLALRKDVLIHTGDVAREAGDFNAAVQAYEESIDLGRQRGELQSAAAVLARLAEAVRMSGDPDRARTLYEESVSQCRALGFERGLVIALHSLGEFERDEGHHAEARALLEESLEIAKRLGDGMLETNIVHGLGDLALELGDLHQAQASYRSALTADLSQDQPRNLAYCLGGLAAVAAASGNSESAGLLWGAVERIEEERATQMRQYERRRYRARLNALDPVSLEPAIERGHKMALPDAIELALRIA